MHPAFLSDSDAPLVGFGDIDIFNITILVNLIKIIIIMVISVIAITNMNTQKSHHMCTHTVN